MTRRPVTKPVKKPANRPPKPPPKDVTTPSDKNAKNAKKGGSGNVKKGSEKSSQPSSKAKIKPTALSWVFRPLELSCISDHNLAIAFKSLQKKDGTTKARAIEELLGFLRDRNARQEEFDDFCIEAWANMYPRTSIDNSRRVRALAHELHGEMVSSCGKRFARFMHQTVGAWIAGLHDTEKSVSRAAQVAFKTAFPTEEKYQAIWKAYRNDLIQFVVDVIKHESPRSLSDEHSTTPDDMNAKYDRVCHAALCMMRVLIDQALSSDKSELETNLLDLFGSHELWKLSASLDTSVRQSIYNLLDFVLDKDIIDPLRPEILSIHVLTAALATPQQGSSLAFVQALSSLTKKIPAVWTEHYQGTGKKSSRRRFIQFLRSGSCAGPKEFWAQLASLIQLLPDDVLCNPAKEAPSDGEVHVPEVTILQAFREGMADPSEIRYNAEASWAAYLQVCKLFLDRRKDDATETKAIIQTSLQPILQHQVRPTPELVIWSIPGFAQRKICSQTALLISDTNLPILTEFLDAQSAMFVEETETSLPEQSKEYAKSQEAISGIAKRWYVLQEDLNKQIQAADIAQSISQAFSRELLASIAIVKARKGEPYGVASAIEQACQLRPEAILHDPIKSQVRDFAQHDIPQLLLSPSSSYLIRILRSLLPVFDIDESLRSSVNNLLNTSSGSERVKAFKSLYESFDMSQNECLETAATQILEGAFANDDDFEWDTILVILQNTKARERIRSDIVRKMVDNAMLSSPLLSALNGLEILHLETPEVMKDTLSETQRNLLDIKLLELIDMGDDSIAAKAQSLKESMNSSSAAKPGEKLANQHIIRILEDNFEKIQSNSLSTPLLLEQAQLVLDASDETNLASIWKKVLPKPGDLQMSLDPHFIAGPQASLAITSNLGPALVLIDSQTSIVPTIPTDSRGLSQAVRLAEYLLGLCELPVAPMPSHERALILQYIAIFAELLGDKLDLSDFTPLWSEKAIDTHSDPGALLIQCQKFLRSTNGLCEEQDMHGILGVLLEKASGNDTQAYYNAKAFTTLKVLMRDQISQSAVAFPSRPHKAQTHLSFDILALWTTNEADAMTLRSFNERLANFPRPSTNTVSAKIIEEWIAIDALLTACTDMLTDVPTQRLVNFVQTIVDWLPSTDQAPTHILRCLSRILPRIHDIYGSFWDKILTETHETLRQSGARDDLLSMHSALLLLRAYIELDQDNSNDDLYETWLEHKNDIASTLLNLMCDPKRHSEAQNKPRRVVNELLCQQMLALDLDITETQGQRLYQLLDSSVQAFQISAYSLLHKFIPSRQSQASIDKALETEIQSTLPTELLSNIDNQPSESDMLFEHDTSHMPSSLRSYLMSWELIFDHWVNASVALQMDYAKLVSEGPWLAKLLDLTFDNLITSRYRPVEASRYSFDDYQPGADDADTETQILLIHLYRLSLIHLAPAVKVWWRDTASRQLNLVVGPWTEKNLSPQVIAEELSAVKEWAAEQDKSDEDEATRLTIKVSLPTREISASVPVDEQVNAISIQLPASYPLVRAEVRSLHRVGVPEAKWQSWLRNAQGQLTTSEGGSNSLIDCLLAWKRNVTATMKGQTECAICYSVVGADKTLPKKKCPTCKNCFHAGCLFRWFKSSNSSSCPLCRNLFHY